MVVDFARVQKELQEGSRDMEASGITVSPKADLARLVGTIPGPIGTPYEGGTFQIDISLPDGYPFEPPKMRFATKVCIFREHQTFVATAHYWTETFAKASSIGVEEKVQKLVEMGFTNALVRSALEAAGGDVNLALEKLCSG